MHGGRIAAELLSKVMASMGDTEVSSWIPLKQTIARSSSSSSPRGVAVQVDSFGKQILKTSFSLYRRKG
jgi:hypothetical protein